MSLKDYLIQDVMKYFFIKQVSLGDTIGVGTPEKTLELITSLKNIFDIEKLAVHFHDTYDKAIENVLVSIEQGILFV